MARSIWAVQFGWLVFFCVSTSDVSTCPDGDGKCAQSASMIQQKTSKASMSDTDYFADDGVESISDMGDFADDGVESMFMADACKHVYWRYGKVCRNADGSANKDKKCLSTGMYWDDGSDKGNPVQTGCTPQEANDGFCQPDGTCPTPSAEDRDKAMYAYSWIPEGDKRVCFPSCAYRSKKWGSGQKIMQHGFHHLRKIIALTNQNQVCKMPRQGPTAWACNYIDHNRNKFYQKNGLANKCNPVPEVAAVFDKCVQDPVDSNCEVTVRGKNWNVLNVCFDEVWDRVCKQHKCFMLSSKLTGKRCIGTCKTFQGGHDRYGIGNSCDDVYKANDCGPDPTPSIPGAATPAIPPAPSTSKEPPSKPEAPSKAEGPCGQGYTFEGDGYWSSAWSQKPPFGQVITRGGGRRGKGRSGGAKISAAECAAKCDSQPSCKGFNLALDSRARCFIYDELSGFRGHGRRTHGQACKRDP